MDSPERLSVYVRRIMAEKNLTFSDIEIRSRKLITGGYVGDIVAEKTTNPTVDKLKALARGLGVSADEIFDVARGVDRSKRGHYGDPFLDNLVQKFCELNAANKADLMTSLRMLDREINERLAQELAAEKSKKKAS